jgi:predicted dienelactone hydrolase
MLSRALIVYALIGGLFTFPGICLAQDNRIDTIRSDAPELARYGTFAVGVKTVKLSNPQQLDIAKFKAGAPMPVYDRPLPVEVWYPAQLAAGQSPGGSLRAITRDGQTEVTLRGRAVRDAAPASAGGPFPLLIISHGYPGNRFLLSHLAENLASKGYVVASIDHTDSTYDNKGAFGSTLLNRSLDQLFVLGEMARLGRSDATLKGLVNAEQTGLIGYSMGGFGALNTIGAGFTAASVAFPWGTPDGALARRQAGNPQYAASMDPRIKATVAFAPWGWNAGFWDAAGLAGVKTPVLFVAGSVDDVSGYAPGVRNLFEGTVNAQRYLLTFENANHNAGAPMPAPHETWTRVPSLDFVPAEHYSDAVWDNVRMNNIAQHFATAFLGKYLKGDAGMGSYLTVVENAKDGKFSTEKDGRFKADHTYWKGFPARSAVGLRLEQRAP